MSIHVWRYRQLFRRKQETNGNVDICCLALKSCHLHFLLFSFILFKIRKNNNFLNVNSVLFPNVFVAHLSAPLRQRWSLAADSPLLASNQEEGRTRKGRVPTPTSVHVTGRARLTMGPFRALTPTLRRNPEVQPFNPRPLRGGQYWLSFCCCFA